MDFINFKVGQNTVALKILDILLTEQYQENLTPLPNERKSFLGIKDVLKTPVPVFDLGLILNQVTTKETNSALIDFLREKEQDHVDWLCELQLSIEEGRSLIKARDPHKCGFCHWYDNDTAKDGQLAAIVEKFVEPHKKLHLMSDEILRHVKGGEIQLAKEICLREERSTYAKLMRLFESVREELTLDYKPIIVFTSKDGITPNIGLLVDKVEDSVSVAEEEIQPLDQIFMLGFDIDIQTKNLMSGLIKHKDSYCLILDPCAIFLENNADDDGAFIKKGSGCLKQTG